MVPQYSVRSLMHQKHSIVLHIVSYFDFSTSVACLLSLYVFLCYVYVNQMSRLVWNGVYSAMVSVSIGVKQSGSVSPFMLLKLADSGVGCWFGKFYVGVVVYADDY